MFQTVILVSAYLLLPIKGQDSSEIDCNSTFGQVELFYEPVHNHSTEADWTFDDDNATAEGVVADAGKSDVEYCYNEYCYYIYQKDNDGDDFEPMLISPNGSINTLGYLDIHIIYTVLPIPLSAPAPFINNLSCFSSYSVDNGEYWNVIYESHPSGFSMGPARRLLQPDFELEVVAASLPSETDNSESLAIAFSLGNRVIEASNEMCIFDEIRICGTPITDEPTTDPTSEPTVEPTSVPTMDPTSDPTSDPLEETTTEFVDETATTEESEESPDAGNRKVNLNAFSVAFIVGLAVMSNLII